MINQKEANSLFDWLNDCEGDIGNLLVVFPAIQI